MTVTPSVSCQLRIWGGGRRLSAKQQARNAFWIAHCLKLLRDQEAEANA